LIDFTVCNKVLGKGFAEPATDDRFAGKRCITRPPLLAVKLQFVR
jgi:hypothetical protein